MARQSVGGIFALIAAAIGLVGYLFFGWRFDQSLNQPVPFVIGLLFAGIAVFLFLTNR